VLVYKSEPGHFCPEQVPVGLSLPDEPKPNHRGNGGSSGGRALHSRSRSL